MPKLMKSMRGVLAAGVVLAITAGSVAQAAGPHMAPQEEAAMRGYVLSMDKINRYGAALQAMERDSKKNPALKAEGKRMEAEPDKTLADLYAKFKRHPAMANYFHRAGLSDQDAVLLPLVLMSASMAMMVPPAKRGQLTTVSPAQIAFVQQHQKELQKMKGMGGDSDD
jgi:hypothetical protein